MKRRHLILASMATAIVGACSTKSKFRSYNGPEVTYVVVNKADRKMFLFNNQRVLNDYDVDLGFAPIGDKFFEGDGRTPEGNYFIDRRNPNSKFHLSIGISYPNAEDRAEAKALGKPPGGDIFIHGKSNPLKRKRDDWTWGCIAVPNHEIELIYAMVKNGTSIQINP